MEEMMEKMVVDYTQSQNTQMDMSIDINTEPIESVIWGRIVGKYFKIPAMNLSKNLYTIGRDVSNDLQLTLNECNETVLFRISKIHFQIEKDVTIATNPAYIFDLSRNGTFINGELIGYRKKQIILNNDVISMAYKNIKAFVYQNLCQTEDLGLPLKITSNYHIGRQLGNGSYGEVRMVFDRKACKQYAMKYIRKCPLADMNKKDSLTNHFRNEMYILRNLNHPCVIKMHGIIHDRDYTIILLELMKGGDLLSRIQKYAFLTESISKLFFIQMCSALKYLHDHKITHRDLKPENILLESVANETLLKISDFGLSKITENNAPLRTICGTMIYIAPEICAKEINNNSKSYTNKVDIWSLGVVLFVCLSGSLPFFYNFEGFHVNKQINVGNLSFSLPIWQTISLEATTIITSMLTVDPKLRPSIDSIIRNEWLNDLKTIKKAEKIMKIN